MQQKTTISTTIVLKHRYQHDFISRRPKYSVSATRYITHVKGNTKITDYCIYMTPSYFIKWASHYAWFINEYPSSRVDARHACFSSLLHHVFLLYPLFLRHISAVFMLTGLINIFQLNLSFFHMPFRWLFLFKEPAIREYPHVFSMSLLYIECVGEAPQLHASNLSRGNQILLRFLAHVRVWHICTV